MRKASRLFDILQILRLASQPVTAAKIAATLEVVPRTIYRDIAELQAMRVPVEGGRGIGYILRAGFTLPPLMFTVEETEALMLALALLDRTGDSGLKRNARTASQKIAAALPPPLRETLANRALHAWGTVTPAPDGIDLALLRQAIREEQKLQITYRDEAGHFTERTLRPIALVYYST
ncbi:MAG: YafY family protein, partial [Paracoccaceae bacterium]